MPGTGERGKARMDQQEIQKKLSEYCRTRDLALRNELVEAHMYLADMVARRYAGKGVETEDLRQVAAMALIGALERYSCGKGIKFTTYAVPTITGVVKSYFRDRSRTIRMPRSIGERVQKISLARERLTQQLGRAPTAEELAGACGLRTADVLEAIEATQSLSVASLDALSGEDEDTPLWALLGSMLSGVMSRLSDAERRILHARYFAERSQRDIAQEMGVSQMYVSRVERKMLARFREALQEA